MDSDINIQLKSLNSTAESITALLLIIVLQGCFGCNKCDHEPTDINTGQSYKSSWHEISTEIKSIPKDLKELDGNYAFNK